MARCTSAQRLSGNPAIRGPSPARSTARIHSGLMHAHAGDAVVRSELDLPREPPNLGRQWDDGHQRPGRQQVVAAEDEKGPALVRMFEAEPPDVAPLDHGQGESSSSSGPCGPCATQSAHTFSFSSREGASSSSFASSSTSFLRSGAGSSRARRSTSSRERIRFRVARHPRRVLKSPCSRRVPARPARRESTRQASRTPRRRGRDKSRHGWTSAGPPLDCKPAKSFAA
jgi:hypothetical protein